LHLIQPLRFYTHGQHRFGDRYVHAMRSRFIPDALLDRFEQVGPPAVRDVTATASRAPKVDIAADLRTMWA
jgi:DNA helicase-2/ATP-dependent DNA helicase PcrA